MESQLILEVLAVDLRIVSRIPLEVWIESVGTTPTPGWRAPQLIAHTYRMPPLDGIYDFDFEAVSSEPPDTDSPEIRVNHHAILPAHAIGVRVISQSNAIETELPAPTASTDSP